MSTGPTTAAHPLVQAYLTDLDRALAGADPRERADVLDGVREHLREALGENSTPETNRVREVLADLGPVEAIAAQAGTAGADATGTRQTPGRDTTSLAALITAILAAATIFIPFVSIPLAIAALVTSAVHLRSPSANRGRCWAGLWVSIATLVITAVAASLLLMVTTEVTTDFPTEATTLSTG